MKTASEENKKIAKTIKEIFRGEPQIWTYADERNESKIDIFSSENQPFKNVTSYSTIGLSDYSIGLHVEKIPLGVEILGTCGSEFAEFANVISTCAFNIINSHFECFPNAIFLDCIKMYYPMLTMKHILFVPPFGWEREFKTLEFSQKIVAWLLAVPISDSELKWAETYGASALPKLFEENQIDIFDLNRPSIFP